MSSIQVAGPPLYGISASGPRTSKTSAQHSRNGFPSAAWGCLLPRTGIYASLYSWMKSGPHHTIMGKLFTSSIRIMVCNVTGQSSGDPSEVDDQSKARISAPISPPPEKISWTLDSSDDCDNSFSPSGRPKTRKKLVWGRYCADP